MWPEQSQQHCTCTLAFPRKTKCTPAKLCRDNRLWGFLFKHAMWQSVAMYTGRSSQPRPWSRLLSQNHNGEELFFISIHFSGYGGQKHHGVELFFISIHFSGYGGVHPQVKQIIQPTGSIILARIKKFYQIVNMQLEDGLG